MVFYETPASKEELLTLEAVRAVLAEKSRSGYTAEVRTLLKNMVLQNYQKSIRRSTQCWLRKPRCLAMGNQKVNCAKSTREDGLDHALLSPSYSHRWLSCPPSAGLCESYERIKAATMPPRERQHIHFASTN
jgi:hypothetical protein